MKPLILTIIVLFSLPSDTVADNKELALIFEKDQEMRKKENIKHWPLYIPLEERNFRLSIYRLLVNGQLKTANDLYRAAIVLLHSGESSIENYLLAGVIGEKLTALGDKRGKDIVSIATSKYTLSKRLPDGQWNMYEINGQLLTNRQVNALQNK